jgi:uncharacterized RDD family membrane protein YckC
VARVPGATVGTAGPRPAGSGGVVGAGAGAPSRGSSDGLAIAAADIGVDDDLVVTAEGVVLDLWPAGPASRVAAVALDALLVYAALAMLSAGIGVAAGAGAPGTVVAMATAVLGGVALLGYPIAMETWWNGRTVGKAAAGLRVVTTEGGPIGFRQAALRGALLLIDVVALPVALVGLTGVVVSRRHQRLGDLAAGTLVVHDRRATLAPAVPYVFVAPSGWEGYVATLDVGRLDDAGYRTIRAFLLRAPQFTARARSALGIELAEAVVARLPSRPPPGTPTEAYLTAVAAAYQQRHRRIDRWASAGGWPTAPPTNSGGWGRAAD